MIRRIEIIASTDPNGIRICSSFSVSFVFSVRFVVKAFPRAAFDTIALRAHRERKITPAQLLPASWTLDSRSGLDGFLKQHEVWLEYRWQDVEHDRETHRRLGL